MNQWLDTEEDIIFYDSATKMLENASVLDDADVIFDLNFDDHPELIEHFAGLENKIVFLSAIKLQLSAVTEKYKSPVKSMIVGMNACPTFINRPVAELTLLNQADEKKLEEIAKQLGISYTLVNDRVGMVSARILFMIINEAYYTLEEGTASKEDINLAMKLGTNYPYGPFEWASRIGIKDIYETLKAVHEDTGNERYEICPMLEVKYQEGEN